MSGIGVALPQGFWSEPSEEKSRPVKVMEGKKQKQ